MTKWWDKRGLCELYTGRAECHGLISGMKMLLEASETQGVLLGQRRWALSERDTSTVEKMGTWYA